jgi:hypothetical protein
VLVAVAPIDGAPHARRVDGAHASDGGDSDQHDFGASSRRAPGGRDGRTRVRRRPTATAHGNALPSRTTVVGSGMTAAGPVTKPELPFSPAPLQ